MTAPQDLPDVEVFSSALPFEAEMIAEALQRARVPFYRRTWSGGIEFAQPALTPISPGMLYLIKVPAPCAPRARKIIEKLHLSPNQNALWPNHMSRRDRNFFRSWGWLQLSLIALFILLALADYCH